LGTGLRRSVIGDGGAEEGKRRRRVESLQEGPVKRHRISMAAIGYVAVTWRGVQALLAAGGMGLRRRRRRERGLVSDEVFYACRHYFQQENKNLERERLSK